MAKSIAGDEYSLYLFEGIRASGNYLALHLTSHRFDEPRCLELIGRCNQVVTVHGCGDEEDAVLLGGRDEKLKAAISQALAAAGIELRSSGHPFPAEDAKNICNRGRSGKGVQLEVPLWLRRSASGRSSLAKAVRQALGASAALAAT